jgi:hypothetical protein
MKKADRAMCGPLSLEKPKLNCRDYIHYATTASATELNRTCCECEESVILTATNICTWVEVSSTLANKNLACINNLSAKALDAEVLWI